MSILNKRLGAKWWALFTLQMLLCLFGVGTIAGWWGNSILGDVALVVIILLMRPMLVLRRRAAGAGGEWSEDPAAAKRRNRRRRIFGIALVVVGIVLVTAGVEFFSNSTLMLGLGLGTAGPGIILVWYSFGRVPSRGATSGEGTVPKTISRFERLMRKVGIALVPLSLFSYVALFLYGYHAIWPLYTFVGIGLASGLVWSYLLAMVYARWLSR